MNNLLLAIITQEFSLAVLIRSYTRTLKQIHLICPRCYSLSLRYSIYKVQSCCFAFADSFCILPHLISFVKNFFQVFSNFFDLWFRSLLGEQLRYVSTFGFICQALFSNSFQIRPLRCSLGAARRRLAYTSTPPPFCQALFSLFFQVYF